MTKTKEEMKDYIAQCYYEGLDIKDLLRMEYMRIVEDLDTWSDSDIELEYKELTDD